MTLSYDRATDTLYIVLKRYPGDADYLESEEGIILRAHPQTGEVLGCTVLSFMKRIARSGRIEIPGLKGTSLVPRLARLISRETAIHQS